MIRFRFSSFSIFYPSFSFFHLVTFEFTSSHCLSSPTMAIDCMSIVVNVFNTEILLRHTPIIMTLDVELELLRALLSTSHHAVSFPLFISPLPGRFPVLFLPSPVSIPFRLSRLSLSLSLSPLSVLVFLRFIAPSSDYRARGGISFRSN